jgi:hypothetical protein
LQVALHIALLKARALAAEVAGHRAARLPMAADQPARQHAIGGDADAELAAGRQDAVLDAARDQ